VQSFNNEKLKYLGRTHAKEQALDKIKLSKKYFDNINVDLIYAIPNETIEELSEDLETIIDLDINHVSAYSLIIEERTILNNKKAQPISEELDYEMYKLICSKMPNHYEISNFGKPSMHNLVYWNNEEYYGFGVGASGYVRGIRYDNTKSLKSYEEGKYRRFEEKLTEEERMKNEFMLGLRKTEGIDVLGFKKKYNREITSVNNIQKLIASKRLILEDNRLYINPEFLYTSNDILVELI